MPISYEKFVNNLPEETRNFLKTLLNYLDSSYSIEFYDFDISSKTDLLLFKTLKAYRKSSQENNNFLNYMGYDLDSDIPYYDPERISSQERGEAFSRYYGYLVPEVPEEEIVTLTAEDIIKNVFNHAALGFYNYKTISEMACEPDKFLEALLEVGEIKKEKYLKKITEKFNSPFSISVINYYDMVGKVYSYLRDHKEEIKRVEVNEDGLKNLAMLIALFYYKHVSVYQDAYNEQKIIVDFLGEKGITIEKIKDKIGLPLPLGAIKKRPNSILILNKYFKNVIKEDSENNNDYTVAYIARKLFDGKVGDPVYIKKILSLFDLAMSNMFSLSEEIKKKKAVAVIDNKILEKIYNDFMPSVVSFFKRVTKIYTYLLTKNDTLSREYVLSDADRKTLAIFLAAYEFSNNFESFFKEQGLTTERVLSLLNLPEESTFYKEIDETEPNELLLASFNEIIFNRISDADRKKTDVLGIISKICYKDNTNSNLIYRLYNTVTDKQLPDSFVKTINEYYDAKEEKRKHQETEEMLQDVSMDVYNFLNVLCGYYAIFKDRGLSSVDLEQLSIIFAASRSNKRLEKYLDGLGMTRNSLAKAFEIMFSYHEAPLDIDVIKKHFTKYIFDRPIEQITVYSIFENAFKKELINSLYLRKGLDKFHKAPEDFLNIEKTLDEVDKSEKEKKEQAKINEIFGRCTDETKEVMENTLRVYEYIYVNMFKKHPLLKSVDDVKEVSLLIALLQHDDIFNQFFEHNGVYLDKALATIGLTKNDLTGILNQEVNRKLVVLFIDYLKDKKIGLKSLVNALLNNNVNKSQVLENLTADTGNNYDYLKEELETEKERNLTPEQGIEVLAKEEVTAITDPSFSSFASYGVGLSKHSKYINESLNDLIRNDSLAESLTSINSLLSKVSYEEEVVTPVKRTSFFDKIFALDPPKQIITKYDQKKLNELGEEIDHYVDVLSKELRSYDMTRKYIETYLRLLESQLHYLEMYKASLGTEEQSTSSNEIDAIINNLNHQAFKRTVDDKIKNTRTTRDLMLQNLAIVYNAIITHLNSIYALDACKNAIIPSLATHLAISTGNKTEKDVLEFTNSLVRLLGSVVNNNLEDVKENLERLETTSMNPQEYAAIKGAVSSYLDKVEEKETLPPAPPKDPILELLERGEPLPPIENKGKDDHGRMFLRG